ncbi:hypothetical protein [Clostridium sp. OS1-26]|uniref:hypothetical protein n=1 Tax=Clostridium sp. OS1-26 TaxID=3070681 RepID=UPI0027E18DFA|nr:hypothetical protein [Clostridium sp. OS1-26]WML35666.1 hypothetical protein RCG18_02625 [Clostridium sp. OS1-26]
MDKYTMTKNIINNVKKEYPSMDLSYINPVDLADTVRGLKNLIESLKSAQITIDDIVELEKITIEEFLKLKDNIYASKCNEFEKTLSSEQQKYFYELERILELRDII